MSPLESPSRRPADLARLGLLLLVGVVMVWAWTIGPLAHLDVPGVRRLVQSQGMLGPLAYVAAFSLLQPLGVSAHLFIVAAGVVWPVPMALLCSQLGLLGGSAVSYGLGRAMAPDTLRSRLPERLLRWEQGLAEGGVRSVLLLRLVCFSFFPLSALMGAIRVPWWAYIVGTVLGCLPVSVGEVLLAHELVDWVDGAG